ncbi:MAG: hypothetical protein NVV62_16650, partial [Terricaulis sp.]|nr:hypothetical protein [Terricaulis sp.]
MKSICQRTSSSKSFTPLPLSGIANAPSGNTAAPRARALIKIQQRPHTDAAIDDILTVIARIIPAARQIERIGTPAPLIAERVTLNASGRIWRMCDRPRPMCADMARLNRDAGALMVEERERRGRDCRRDWARLRTDGLPPRL